MPNTPEDPTKKLNVLLPQQMQIQNSFLMRNYHEGVYDKVEFITGEDVSTPDVLNNSVYTKLIKKNEISIYEDEQINRLLVDTERLKGLFKQGEEDSREILESLVARMIRGILMTNEIKKAVLFYISIIRGLDDWVENQNNEIKEINNLLPNYIKKKMINPISEREKLHILININNKEDSKEEIAKIINFCREIIIIEGDLGSEFLINEITRHD